MAAPILVVVGGPPGSGKTTLAHRLAAAIPCLAICRDEIKEGMVHAHGPGFEPAPGDPLTQRTVDVFLQVLRDLLAGGASVVAEAAFQDRLWRHVVEPLLELAELRVVHCRVDAAIAWDRAAQSRAPRAAHAVEAHVASLDAWTEHFASFQPISLAAPSIVVETTDGYTPDLAEIVRFVNDR